jgi:hypothetical protein
MEYRQERLSEFYLYVIFATPHHHQYFTSEARKMCGTMGTDLYQHSREFSHLKIFKQEHRSWVKGQILTQSWV